MTLLRAIALCSLALAATLTFAANPKVDSALADSSPGSDTQLHSKFDLPHLVPWFTGLKSADSRTNSDTIVFLPDAKTVLLPGTLEDSTCYKLRAYKVKRQERFREGESASLGHSTCQWASRFRLHSAVQTTQQPSQ